MPSATAAHDRGHAPVSIHSRSRYVIVRRANGSFSFELRAHNGSCLLSADEDANCHQDIETVIEQVRRLIAQNNAIQCRQSLTGKWYFVVHDGERILASSRPFDYRSRMEKALYAAQACAPGARIAMEA